MKKLLLVMVIMIVVSASLFAGIENLSVNKDTMMMTYTYVVEKQDISVEELVKNRKYKAYALAEFSGTLQQVFELDSVNFSQFNYSFESGKIIMKMSFETFYKLNLM